MTRNSRAAAVAIASLTACTTAVDEPTLIGLRDRAGGSASGAQETVGESAAATPLGTLDLARALELAAASRIELATARAERDAAAARAEGAGLFPDPRLIARAEAAPLEGRALADADLLAGVSQPLPLSDRRAAERDLAAAAIARADADVAQTERAIGTEVRRAFATALFTQYAAQVRTALAEQAEALRAPVEARAAAGDATASDRAQAAIVARESAVAARAANRVANLARGDLAAAIGMPAAPLDAVSGDLDEVLALPELALLVARLADHPALRAAQADAATAAAALELAREERIPDLELDLLYRRIGVDDVHAFDVGLSIPLRSSRRADAAIAAAQSDERAARSRTQANAREFAAALRNSHARLASALDARATLQREIVPLHDERVRIETARLAAGDARPEELLRAQLARSEAEAALLDATEAALAAWSDLRALVP